MYTLPYVLSGAVQSTAPLTDHVHAGDNLLTFITQQAWSAERTRAGTSSREGAYQLRKWCRDHFVSDTVLDSMRSLREQFRDHLVGAGFIAANTSTNNSNSSSSSSSADSEYAGNAKLLQCVLCAGLYPQVAWFVRPKSRNLGKHCHCVYATAKRIAFLCIHLTLQTVVY
jgi:hypothetical protein